VGDHVKYQTIFADPPWRYGDRGSRISPDHAGHYTTMSLDEICELYSFVDSVVGTDAHLWLCCTNAFLVDGSATKVARTWGFVPKTILTWCKESRAGKVQIGMGHYLRNSTEHVMFCVRGKLAPLVRNVPSHVYAPRTKHSAKPAELYEVVEKVSPGPRLEMFARASRDGWDSWGEEAPVATKIGVV
jgi:N6-adenosine-specific RNA methylase IME4